MAKSKGRPRKPDHLKVVEGTDRPDRMNADAPRPDSPLGDPPDRMTETAAELWSEHAPELWWLTGADRSAYERYCEWFALWLQARHEVEGSGPYQTAESGYEAPSGAMTAMSKAESAMDKIAAGLGLDPSSRSGIKMGEKPVESPWNQFKEK